MREEQCNKEIKYSKSVALHLAKPKFVLSNKYYFCVMQSTIAHLSQNDSIEKKTPLIINTGLLSASAKEGNGKPFILYKHGNISYIFLETRHGLVTF